MKVVAILDFSQSPQLSTFHFPLSTFHIPYLRTVHLLAFFPLNTHRIEKTPTALAPLTHLSAVIASKLPAWISTRSSGLCVRGTPLRMAWTSASLFGLEVRNVIGFNGGFSAVDILSVRWSRMKSLRGWGEMKMLDLNTTSHQKVVKGRLPMAGNLRYQDTLRERYHAIQIHSEYRTSRYIFKWQTLMRSKNCTRLGFR